MSTPVRIAIAACVVLLAGTVVVLAAGTDQERLGFGHHLRDRPSLPGIEQVSARLPAAPRGEPPEAAEGGWPYANHDLANTRATTDSTIDSNTVGRLGVAWVVHLTGASKWGSAATAPLIIGDSVYFQSLMSDVFKIDLRSGEVAWEHPFRQKAFGPNGPAVGWGRVYVPDGDRNIAALDEDNGRILWSSPLAGPTGQQQPVVWSNGVFTGIAAGRKKRGAGQVQKTALLEPGASGFAYALRAQDGRPAWEFQTVEPGFWGHADLNGGGGIWFPPAIDEWSGTTFWSTGNPGPAPGTVNYPNGSSRPGPNLYTNTLLALNWRTGDLRWFKQLLPHDLFHHDLQNAPILIRAAGKDLVVASGKMGIVYALDRQTGEIVWQTPVGRHENDGLEKLPLDAVVTVYPGFWGGIETPGAYADGTLYFQVDDLPTPYTATGWDSRNGQQTVDRLEGHTEYARGTSLLVALDAATGRIRWEHRFPTVGFAAATVVNDLVFTSTYDGTAYALRRSDGSVAWKWRAPGGINAWPAVYGDTLVWPVGLGLRPSLMALRLDAPGNPVRARARPQKASK